MGRDVYGVWGVVFRVVVCVGVIATSLWKFGMFWTNVFGIGMYFVIWVSSVFEGLAF